MTKTAPADLRAAARANESQRVAGAPGDSAWVTAHAGSGKTTVLVGRLRRLLLAGVAPHRILCLTFTKAAAAEMRIRLARELEKWATMPEEALAADLETLEGARPSPAAIARARRLFAEVLEAPGGLQIDTLHAFCQSVLKRFPLEAGVAPHFALLDETAAAQAREAARRHVLERARAGVEAPLSEALALVTASQGEDGFDELLAALLGRTHDLVTFRDAQGGVEKALATLWPLLGLEAGETPARATGLICALEARHEKALRAVARAMQGSGKTDDRASGALAQWLSLDAAGRAAGLDDYLPVFFTVDGERRKNLVTGATKKKLAAAEETMTREAERLEALLARRRAAATAVGTAALLRLGYAAIAAYEAHKKARAELDFHDLILRTAALLGDGRAPWVMFKLDGGIEHILVDEAQDTSRAQWELIRRLTGEFFADAAEPRRRTLFVVGDFKQSIFGFQGAAPEQFGAMHKSFTREAAAVGRAMREPTLDVSFRSAPAVLDFVDRVFAPDAARAGVADKPFRHIAARASAPGSVEVWPTVPPTEKAKIDDWAVPQSRRKGENSAVARLAEEMAKRIAGWIGRERLPSLGRTVRAGDVMILVRRRQPFAPAIIRALKAAKVSVTGVDRMVLTDQIAVRDLLALGRFLVLPEDDLTLACVLKGPFFNFTDDAHLFPLAHKRPASLWARLREPAAERPEFAAAAARLAAWLARADFAPPYELFAGILEAEGGRREILARLGRDAEDSIDLFLERALAYQRERAPSLQGFLHWIEAQDEQIKRDLEPGARDEVRVMTVHGAKGLEAPIVFLPDTAALPADRDELLWPDAGDGLPLWTPARADEPEESERRRAARQLRQAEEYRRLLYVGLTRARDRLIVCGWENKHGVQDGSWYDLVRRALPAEAAHEFALPWGGKGWRLESGDAEETKAAARPARPIAALPGWAERPAPAEPLPPRPLAPSRGEAEPPVRSPFEADDAQRFRRGLIVHRLLQSLPDLPGAAREAAARRYLALPAHGLAAAAQAELLRETMRLFEDPAFAPLFAPGSLAEVPIAGLAQGRAVSGQIDRLIVRETEVWIADYKTNRPPPADPAGIPAAYLDQMAAYAGLVRHLYPGRAVRCLIVWTDGPRLMEVPEALLAARAASARLALTPAGGHP